MKIKKGNYGYQINCYSKDDLGNYNNYYMDCNVPKIFMEDEIEGELVFKVNGDEYPCFLSSYQRRNGAVVPKMIVYIPKPKQEEQPQEDSQELKFDPEQLPFY